jgi:SAM-dependent methyltransferase
MAVSCPTGFDTTRLREEVSSLYAKVAQSPQGDFHFHTGPAYAAERLGYSADLLALLPSSATSSFAGVGNPLAIDVVGPDQTVVEVGCGGGMDLLLAARRAKWVVGVDMTTQMLDRARAGVWSALASNVELRKGDAESLPVEDQYADVVISNGVLNLTTDKEQAFREVFRVLKPGGRLLLADIAVEAELSENIRSRIDLWTA